MSAEPTVRLRLTPRGRAVGAALLAAIAMFILVGLISVAFGGGGGTRTLVVGEPEPKAVVVETLNGEATFYGPGLPADAVTASGVPFDPSALTAAHSTLEFGTRVRVSRPDGSQSVLVTVNDRLPDGGAARIDVTRAAAEQLGMVDEGRVPVILEVLGVRGQ